MSKPKQSDYKASEADKANASVGLAQKNFFNKEILPQIKAGADRAFTEQEGIIGMAEGTANADFIQALTNNPNRNAVMAVDMQADLTSAGIDQLLQGTTQGLAASTNEQVGMVKAGAGINNQTTSALADVSKIATTDTLNLAKAKYARTSGMIGAVQKVGTGLGDAYQTMKGYNMGQDEDDKINIWGNTRNVG